MSLAATRARRLRLAHLRSLSSYAEGSSSRPASDRGPPSSRWLPKENIRSLHPRMVFVRPWEGVPTMAHAFAIIREIEKRFGKVQEFVVLRDSDVWTNNLPYMHATFARPELTDAIPIEGRVIQVALPEADPTRDGGVGLDDLEAYLDSSAQAAHTAAQTEGIEDTDQNPDLTTEIRMTDVKIERTGMRDAPTALDFMLSRRGGRSMGPSPLLRNPQRAREVGEAVVAFGGFASVQKVASNPDKPKTRMQVLVERWSSRPDQQTHAFSKKPEPAPELPADPIPWEPFAKTEAAQPLEASLDAEPRESPADVLHSSSPSPPSPPLSSPLPPSPVATPSPPKTQTPSKPEPVPKQKPQPAAPKLSNKQRMVLAARAAGAQAASKAPENDYGSLQDPVKQETPAAASAREGVETRHVPPPAPAVAQATSQVSKNDYGGLKDTVRQETPAAEKTVKVLESQRVPPPARAASAQTASRAPENDFGHLQNPTEQETSAADGAREDVEDPAAESPREPKPGEGTQQENSRAASKWWGFLTGGKR